MTFKKTLLGYSLAFLYVMLNTLGQIIIKDYLPIPSTLSLFMRVITIFLCSCFFILLLQSREGASMFKTDNLALQAMRGAIFSVVSFFRYQSIQYIPLVVYTAIALSERVVIVLISLILGEEREYKSLLSIVALNVFSILVVQFGPAWLDVKFDNSAYYIGIMFALLANILCASSGYITASIHRYSSDNAVTTALYTSGFAAIILPILIIFFDDNSYSFLIENGVSNILSRYKMQIVRLCIVGVLTQYLSIYIFKYIDPNTQSSISSSSVIISAGWERMNQNTTDRTQPIAYLGVTGIIISMLLVFRRDFLKKKGALSSNASLFLSLISLIAIVAIFGISYRLYDPSIKSNPHIGCGCCGR